MRDNYGNFKLSNGQLCGLQSPRMWPRQVRRSWSKCRLVFWRWTQNDLPKLSYLPIKIHGVTTHRIASPHTCRPATVYVVYTARKDGARPALFQNFCVILCIVCVSMFTVLLPPSGYPITVNKYIISYITLYHIVYHIVSCHGIIYHILYRIISYRIS